MPGSKNSKGFTLLELIVVIALAAIILGFTIPRIRTSFLTDNTRKYSRLIMATVASLKTRAVDEQRRYTLNLEIDEHKFWVTHEAQSEEEREQAAEQGQKLSEDLRFLDVDFGEDQKLSTGLAQINFYKGGYSDRAVIHLEDDDDQSLSFLIEPFLPRTKRFETYVSLTP